ncbi:MAG: inositol monophosphatase family protein [Thermoleophilia bacterium]
MTASPPPTGSSQARHAATAPTFSAAPDALRALLVLAREAARDAGRVHRDGAREALHVETKSTPTDLVSQIDREAERLIVERIRERRPYDGILAEEGALVKGTSGVRWVIDPLDGTTNYVYGYPAYAVSIAVEIDDRVRVGVVYESSADRLFEAIEGYGARGDGARLEVCARTELPRALIATGFSYEASQRRRQGEVIAGVLGRVRDIRRGGSAALDLCHVASGHVDAYWELGLAPWDYAAGALIAREAGAEVQVIEAPGWRGPAIVAAPQPLFAELLALLNEVDAFARP